MKKICKVVCLMLICAVLFALSACNKKPAEPVETNNVPDGLKEGDVVNKDPVEMQVLYALLFKTKDGLLPASEKMEITSEDKNATTIERFISNEEKYSCLKANNGSVFYEIIALPGIEYLKIKTLSQENTYEVDDQTKELISDISNTKSFFNLFVQRISSDGISNISYKHSIVHNNRLCDLVYFDYQEEQYPAENQYAEYILGFNYAGQEYLATYYIDKNGIKLSGDFPEKFQIGGDWTWDMSEMLLKKDDEMIPLTIIDFTDQGFLDQEKWVPIVYNAKYALCVDSETHVVYEIEEWIGSKKRDIVFDDNIQIEKPVNETFEKIDLESAILKLMDVIVDMSDTETTLTTE